MGNAPTKEVRSASSSTSGSSPGSTKNSSLLINSSLSRDFLGVSDRHSAVANYGQQRKKKEKEKEKRRLEQEQIMGLIVRYDENVDGGYLAPYGNYKYNLNYKNEIVHDLILKRKLAPFYTPLMDYDESWSNEELLNYLKGNLKLHASVNVEDLNDDEEDPDDHKIYQSANSVRRRENKIFRQKMKEQAIKLQKEEEFRYTKDKKSKEHHPFRYPNIPSDDLLLRIYGESEECPICFLYYPKLMNLTRCCVQPICTECFVQMKRLDPHFRHDDEQGRESSNNKDKVNDLENPEDLISEPVKCPFCAMEDFGVTYTPPEFKTGMGGGNLPFEYKEGHKHEIIEEGDETNEEELANPFREPKARKVSVTHRTSVESSITRHRRDSLPADAPSVVTIDMIRPDWEQRLLSARTKMARRSAAATALHATSLIMNNQRERGGRGHHAGRTQLNGATRREQVDIEEKMVEEAMRLSLLDEEERLMKERERKQSNR